MFQNKHESNISEQLYRVVFGIYDRSSGMSTSCSQDNVLTDARATLLHTACHIQRKHVSVLPLEQTEDRLDGLFDTPIQPSNGKNCTGKQGYQGYLHQDSYRTFDTVECDAPVNRQWLGSVGMCGHLEPVQVYVACSSWGRGIRLLHLSMSDCFLWICNRIHAAILTGNQCNRNFSPQRALVAFQIVSRMSRTIFQLLKIVRGLFLLGHYLTPIWIYIPDYKRNSFGSLACAVVD